jgi:hypothetical protein
MTHEQCALFLNEGQQAHPETGAAGAWRLLLVRGRPLVRRYAIVGLMSVIETTRAFPVVMPL